MRIYYLIIFLILSISLPDIISAQMASKKFSISDDNDLNDSYSKRSPKGAMIRSLILPGWGQIYNRKFIKALVFLGGETYFMSRFLDLNDELRTLERTSGVSASDIEDKEQERNGWGWLFGAGYFLAMGDAFVDAHLDGVSIDEEFSVKLLSNKQKSRLSLQLQYNF